MRSEIVQIGEAIQSTVALTEEKFLEIGKRLESAIEILGRLTARFGKLKAELDGEEIQHAARGLTEVATQISAIATTHRSERDKLDRLHRLAAGIDSRAVEMRTEMKTIDVLTMNARVAAASIGDAGADFLDYMNEIAPSLRLTQTHLEEFKSDLGQAGTQLAAARAGEAEFHSRYATVVGSIPDRLRHSVELIGTRRQKAAAAASTIGGKSQHVSGRIASAVMALQIGDATRQRLEHTQLAARLLTQVLAPGSDAKPGSWRSLSEAQRRQLAAAGCRLQAAQLNDTANEFERDVGSVLSALRQLASDAGDIVRLSNDTYGSSDQRGNAFLRELEDDVGEAQALFEGFRTARVKADQVMSSVLAVAGRLSTHISTVQSLETDIRIVGFNTTFKCGRLGVLGLPLKVIAQELRACSSRTAQAADAITLDVQEITATAGSLTGEEQASRPEQIAAVTSTMTDSLALVRAAGESLAAALHSLSHDGAAVATLIDETLARMAVHEEIAKALRNAADNFAELADSVPPDSETIGECGEQLFAEIAASYTMARERDIHAMVIQGAAVSTVTGAAASGQTAPQSSLDDILF